MTAPLDFPQPGDTAVDGPPQLPHRVEGEFTTRTTPRGCMVTGCQLDPLAMVVCPAHWKLLPQRLRDGLWNTYRESYLSARHPDNDYKAALRQAVDWLEKNTEFAV